jgi:hypothetical protein
VQEDSNLYYGVASLFKEKAAVEGTPPSAGSGLAAFSNDGWNFFQHTSSVIFLSLFVFCILFFHSVPECYFKDFRVPPASTDVAITPLPTDST